ncbi:MAG: BON domain-containing protein [Planctomycetaceae bacterium]|nr:BON domain-containing protein [Planctomycetaceae bacterium]
MSAPALPFDRYLSDQRLADELARRVRARCGRSLDSFAVSIRQGVATLHGQVRGFYQKQVMLTIVLAVPGIVQVIDQVEVLPLAPPILMRGSAELEEQSAA